MEKTVKRVKKNEKQSDFEFWQSQSYQKRLETLETIREEYHGWKYDTKPRFQRVLRIVKRK